MADIAISYSHLDELFAGHVRQAFTRLGVTVWMDEAEQGTGGAEGIALPWGQAHWDVITTEFAAADVVVVIDTPNWRASKYCQDEYRFLLEWGMAVEFINAPTSALEAHALDAEAGAIVGRHAERRPVTGAHARLVQSVRSGRPSSPGRLERLLGRAEERDARVVMGSTPEASGVTLTPRLEEYARAALDRARKARQRLRRIAFGTIAVLTVLALVGVVALVVARSSYRTAAETSARSQSLALAAQAQTEPDTVKALALARRAETLAPGPAATEAINVASARDARMRTIIVSPEDFFGAAWAARAPRVIGYSATKLVPIDVDTGRAGQAIDVPEGIQIGSVVVSADGTRVAFATRDTRALHVAHLADNRIEDVGVSGISAVTTADGDELWWATNGSGLTVAPFADLASRREYVLPSTAYALDVTPARSLLDVVGADGRVYTATYDQSTVTEIDAFDVAPADKVAPVTRQAVAAVTRCGENLFGGLAGSAPINGIQFSRVEGVVATKRLFGSMSKPVCSDDDKAWFTIINLTGPIEFVPGTRRPRLPHRSGRYLAVADPTEQRTAVLTNDGRLYQTFEHPIRYTAAEGAVAVLPMSSGDVYVTAAGDVVAAATGTVTSHVDGRPLAQTAAVLGDDGMVATPAGFAHVDGSGVAQSVTIPGALDELSNLRAGADGGHFVAAFSDTVVIIARDGTRSVPIPVGELEFGESVTDADIAPDGRSVAFTTNSGRVGALAVNLDTGSSTAPQMWEQRLAGGRYVLLNYVPGTDDLVVVAPDGVARLLDEDFAVVARAFIGTEPRHLTTVGDRTIVTSDAGTVLYDPRTLLVKDRISQDEVAATPATVRLDAAKSRLVVLSYDDPTTGADAERVEVPLPELN